MGNGKSAGIWQLGPPTTDLLQGPLDDMATWEWRRRAGGVTDAAQQAVSCGRRVANMQLHIIYSLTKNRKRTCQNKLQAAKTRTTIQAQPPSLAARKAEATAQLVVTPAHSATNNSHC